MVASQAITLFGNGSFWWEVSGTYTGAEVTAAGCAGEPTVTVGFAAVGWAAAGKVVINEKEAKIAALNKTSCALICHELTGFARL